MTQLKAHLQAIALTFAALIGAASQAVHAKEISNELWVKDEISLDGSAQIYLSPIFSAIKGRFKAIPESVMDKRNAIEGNFLIGKYRYLFIKPTRGTDGKLSDELVSTEILDCNGSFFGTMKQVRKYKGAVINSRASATADVTMMQTTVPNVGSKLCALYQNKKGPVLEQRAVTNPNYNPNPTKQEIDRILDKYDTPKVKKTD